MKPFRLFFLWAVMSLLLLNVRAQQLNFIPSIPGDAVVVLYDNDPHGETQGYVKMAGLRNCVKEKTQNVAVVSCGDFLGGNPLSALTKGSSSCRMINAVGYDFVTLGNHEFDYGVSVMDSLLSHVTPEILCCNFREMRSSYPYRGYAIKEFGDVKVAFIGVATPSTYSGAGKSKFRDRRKNILYDFHGEDLWKRVQQQVNAARQEGAQYVVVLSHLGTGDLKDFGAGVLIANTYGIDVVLDGHSHSVIEDSVMTNKAGKPVILTSTGHKFANIGALIIRGSGEMQTVLIPQRDFESIPDDVAAKKEFEAINREYEPIMKRVVGHSDVLLTIFDASGKRISRQEECNLGDFAADAFRLMGNADIGLMSGGGCRGPIHEGKVTVENIYTAFSFVNNVLVDTISGWELLDALEWGVETRISDDGGFLHVSGLTYCVDMNAQASVKVVNDRIVVAGERRVYNVRVYNKEKGINEVLDPDKRYTIATVDFLLCDEGNNFHFYTLAPSRNLGPQQKVIEQYIEYLGGTIDERYAQPQGRIFFKK